MDSAQADTLVQKIKHFIITSFGCTAAEASITEFYQAFVTALREEVMINWTATHQTFHSRKERTLYFLSMEYLPGRLLNNNISNLTASELIQAVLKKMNRNWSDLLTCETEAGLGNGGLGRLASCFLDSLATMQYPAKAYGLRYQYGMFEQELWNGQQVEKPDCWLLNGNAWELRNDAHAVSIHFRGTPIPAKNSYGDEAYLLEHPEEVRALPYDTPIIGYDEVRPFAVLTLRLWSTKESPRNFQLQRFNAGFLDEAAENTCLTDVLYPADYTETGKRVRLKQEFLLVSASLQDILREHLITYGDISSFSDKVRIQINDTHPALIIAELLRTLTKNYDIPWKQALETTIACCSYTNHTILREALEEWQESRLFELIPRQYQIIQKLNHEFCHGVRKKYPNDEDKVRRLSIIEEGQVRMSHLAIAGCHHVNGVARLHSEILKTKIFHDFYDLNPTQFVNVTNGVTHRRWLLHANPLLSEFISKRIGREWILDFSQISKLARFASDPKSQTEFLEIKQKNKERLVSFLQKENPIRDAQGRTIAHSQHLNPNALFDVQIKRFHEYKRQLLNALHLIMLYQEGRPFDRLSLFGGKAASGYRRAKQILLLIYAIARKIEREKHPHLRVVFVENYNVSKAELIIPAADLSEQISTAGWEASGTGNMKLAMNGALTLCTDDGANVEMRAAVTDRFWPFVFGCSSEEISSMQEQQTYSSQDIYFNDPTIRKAVDALIDGTFSESPEEAAAFAEIHHSLIENDTGGRPDRFFVLKDLRAYYEAQKKVEALYVKQDAWAEIALNNIASMGRFSTDESIRNYAREIWKISPSPLDPVILEKVRAEYSEHDRCRISS